MPLIGNCSFANNEITRIFLTKWTSNIITYFSPNTTGILNNQISGFTGLTENWSEIKLFTANVKYTQALNPKNSNGINFTESITITIPDADLSKWADLTPLLKNKYVIVFEDANGNYWELGHKFGLKITTYKREENQYLITFASASSVPLLESIIENYVINTIISGVPISSPSATPSHTPSLSVSSSIVATPTVTPSLSLSATPTVTPSLSLSATPSLSLSATPSLSISETPTVTPSLSLSATPTVTPSLSLSATPSLSLSATPSLSISETPTVTPSLSLSTTPTVTPSLSLSITPTVTLSITPTITPSITPTITPSITPSVTPGLTGLTGFITEWTVAGDDAARTITLPFTDNGTYNATIYWGDGAVSGVTTFDDVNRIHKYDSDGTYQIEIQGEAPGWSMLSHPDASKVTAIINWGDASLFGGFSYLEAGFYQTAITSLGTGKILAKNDLLLLDYLFTYCNITSIPSGLFDNCINVTNLSLAFAITNINNIPANLFDSMTLVTVMDGLFERCSSITSASIPDDIFRYNTEITSVVGIFRGTSMTYIPDDIFKYNTKIYNFNYAFGAATITGVTDANLFKYTLESTVYFDQVFFQCTDLEVIPDGLFDGVGISFVYSFYGCDKLQINPYTFITTTGQTATRFYDLSPNFSDCFERYAFTGNQGEAPNLWDYNYGIGTPTTTTCFGGTGNDGTSISNYGDIPAGWIT